MIRLILLIGMIYLGVKVHRAWRKIQGNARRSMAGSDPARVDDIMVKDPFCEVYFPRRKGVRALIKGEELYFCSPECRDKYAAKN